MKYEFEAEIKRLEGKIQWSVIYSPESTEECFGTKGKIPVKVTVDGHPFDQMLLSSRNGHYFVYNEFIRRAVGKDLGDTLRVTLEKDDTVRELRIPSEVEQALKEHNVLESFSQQPDYLKREQLNKIELAKKEETRLNRLQKRIQYLSDQ